MRHVLSALDHAHRHEVIHRSLTPDLILITKRGSRASPASTSPEWARVEGPPFRSDY
jgi:serine/threonine protein kinase